MQCDRHQLAAGRDGRCVLCRRDALPAAHPARATGARASRSRTLPLLALLACVALGGAGLWRYALASRADLAPFLPGTRGTLQATNSAGRHGAYFLPSHYEGQSLPLLVAIHGTAGSGATMVSSLREAAERDRFFVVAPDSRGGPGGDSWEVGDHPGEVTPDLEHVNACVAELLAMPGVRVDPTRVLILGFSGGGSTAPYVATNAGPFTAFAVLHGGVFAGGLGKREVRGWFSTGKTDTFRTPASVRAAADLAKAAGVREVEYRVYPGGHGMGERELEDVLAWWLGSGFRAP